MKKLSPPRFSLYATSARTEDVDDGAPPKPPVGLAATPSEEKRRSAIIGCGGRRGDPQTPAKTSRSPTRANGRSEERGRQSSTPPSPNGRTSGDRVPLFGSGMRQGRLPEERHPVEDPVSHDEPKVQRGPTMTEMLRLQQIRPQRTMVDRAGRRTVVRDGSAPPRIDPCDGSSASAGSHYRERSDGAKMRDVSSDTRGAGRQRNTETTLALPLGKLLKPGRNQFATPDQTIRRVECSPLGTMLERWCSEAERSRVAVEC